MIQFFLEDFMNNKIKWSITIFLVISLVLGMFACKQEADPDAPEEVLSLGDQKSGTHINTALPQKQYDC